MAPSELDAVVAAWCDLDRARALLAADREIIEASASLRGVVVGFALAGGSDEEIYDACAALGRMVAEAGGSPTLAAQTIDHAVESMRAQGAPWITAARAAVGEGFALALTDKVHERALRSWEFPHCAVPLGDGAVAIAAGRPSSDAESTADWAARVAKAAALKGYRRAFVSGPEAARAALAEALDVVGVEVLYAGSRT